MNFATIIQKTWRGHNTRKIYAAPVEEQTSNVEEKRPVPEEKSKSKLPPPIPPVPLISIPPKDEADAYSEDTSSLAQNVIKPKRLSSQLAYSKQYNIDVIVDGIVGLPIVATATRLQVKLMMPMKEVVGESNYEYCDITSDSSCPLFRLRHQWKGKVLHPTITVVCQVETLDLCTLLPKIVGIAVLRLCVDNVGLQPISEVIFDDR